MLWGKAVFRVQHLQWLGILAAAIGCMLLGGAAVLSNLAEHQRHSLGAEELQRFVLLLDGVNAVTAERVPSNAAIGADALNSIVPMSALSAERARTDAALASMEKAFAQDIGPDAFRLLRDQLAIGRKAVDAVTSTPFAERTPAQIAEAAMSMFTAADRAADIRGAVSSHILRHAPQLAGEIMLANSASALREYEGRLGYYVVLALISPAAQDPRYIHLMRQSEAIVRSLWNTGLSTADALLADSEIEKLVDAVQADYFEGSLLAAHRAIRDHAADNSLPVKEFAAQYAPGTFSSDLLRLHIVDYSTRILRADAERAMQNVVKSAALTVAILAVLILVDLVFRRALFSPLMRVHNQVVALAEGDHRDPGPVDSVAREVDDIYAGLEILRKNLAEKRVLEDEQRQLNRRLRRLAETDTLTGLLNRRALLSRVDALFRRADRHHESLAIALFDIDHFKAVNDTYGHSVGDEVLAGIARLVNAALRPGDMLARIGGEEFVIILRRVDEDGAFHLLDTLRLMLAQTSVQERIGLRVTASFGVAMRPAGAGMDWDEIFSLADQRLYLAKNSGRNQVVIEGMSSDTRRRA